MDLDVNLRAFQQGNRCGVPKIEVVTLNTQPGIAFAFIASDGSEVFSLDSTICPDVFERSVRFFGFGLADLKLAAKNGKAVFIPEYEEFGPGGGYAIVRQTRTMDELRAAGEVVDETDPNDYAWQN